MGSLVRDLQRRDGHPGKRPVGRLLFSAQAVIKRDEVVIGMCTRRNIPVVMVLSGGYQKNNAEVIAESIENLDRQFNRR